MTEVAYDVAVKHLAVNHFVAIQNAGDKVLNVRWLSVQEQTFPDLFSSDVSRRVCAVVGFSKAMEFVFKVET